MKPIPFAAIESRIHVIRGKRVMLDADLAALYGVATKNLNKAMTRNRDRFPEDFVCRLTAEEFANLRFHSGTSKQRGGRRYLPHAFTQEGIAMLSGVLHSPRAVAVNIEIMRAFVRMRGMLLSVDDLARKVEALERKAHAHDTDLATIFTALKELMTPPQKPRREIGFHSKLDESDSKGAKSNERSVPSVQVPHNRRANRALRA